MGAVSSSVCYMFEIKQLEFVVLFSEGYCPFMLMTVFSIASSPIYVS